MVVRKAHIEKTGQLLGISIFAVSAFNFRIFYGQCGDVRVFGFIYYARYFRIIPDELFKSNVQRACTAAWLSELIILVPLTYICTFVQEKSKVLGTAFGLSFATAIFIFTIILMVLEYRESNGVFDD